MYGLNQKDYKIPGLTKGSKPYVDSKDNTSIPGHQKGGKPYTDNRQDNK